MEITMTKSILKDVYSNSIYTQIDAFLNSVIDEELLNDDVNTDLIDQCIDALDNLYNGEYSPALKLVLSEKSVLKYCKNSIKPQRKLLQKIIVASVVITLSTSTVAYNTVPAFAESVNNFFSQIISALNLTADESEISSEDISSIYGVFPEGYSFSVKSESEINIDDIKIFAVYKNNEIKEIPLSKCTVNTENNLIDNENKIMVVIAYEGCAFSVIYTVEE